MDAFLWMSLPLFVAAGSALLSYYLMKARMEVLLAKERETAAQLRAELVAHEKFMEQRIRTAEEQAQRKALDAFLADFRVEERQYLKESKSLYTNKKSMVLQERLYFRNLPLSNWVEREMTVEDGGEVQQIGQGASIFSAPALTAGRGPAHTNGNGVERLVELT
jgi:hypothetical protein